MRTLFVWIEGSSSSIPSHLWLRRLQEIQDGAIAATAYQRLGKKIPCLQFKAPFPINLLAKIRTRKNKSWMESLSLHMVY